MDGILALFQNLQNTLKTDDTKATSSDPKKVVSLFENEELKNASSSKFDK